jgi:uncharacterized protein YndB with AHSA1/START domain
MSERSIEHASFVLERSYDASPAEVFAAWADPAVKARWFAGPGDWEGEPHELDFRVGGQELSSEGPRGGPVHIFRAIYWDIVPNKRIVYTYEMLRDETRISVSLATVDLRPEGDGTQLVLTEHGAFFDALEPPELRRQGTGSLLDALAHQLKRSSKS